MALVPLQLVLGPADGITETLKPRVPDPDATLQCLLILRGPGETLHFANDPAHLSRELEVGGLLLFRGDLAGLSVPFLRRVLLERVFPDVLSHSVPPCENLPSGSPWHAAPSLRERPAR